ncbi:hypothetical protein GOODEAATRI_004655, partial [Goodea atripinnis]
GREYTRVDDPGNSERPSDDGTNLQETSLLRSMVESFKAYFLPRITWPASILRTQFSVNTVLGSVFMGLLTSWVIFHSLQVNLLSQRFLFQGGDCGVLVFHMIFFS